MTVAECNAGNTASRHRAREQRDHRHDGVRPHRRPGHRDRRAASAAINAGDPADVLCVAMDLPLATTSAFAGANATVTLTFDAEQTRNNA